MTRALLYIKEKNLIWLFMVAAWPFFFIPGFSSPVCGQETETGALQVLSDIPETEIVIEGRTVGVAGPETGLLLTELPAMEIMVHARVPKIEEKVKSVVVKPDATTVIRFRFLNDVPFPASSGLQNDSSPEKMVEALLKKGKILMEQERFTTPESENAFDVHRNVLVLDPDNKTAKKRIQEIFETYYNWGEAAFAIKDYERAKTFFSRFMEVAEYALDFQKNESLSGKIDIVGKKQKIIRAKLKKAKELVDEGNAFFRRGILVISSNGQDNSYDKQPVEEPADAFHRYKAALFIHPFCDQAKKGIYNLLKNLQINGDQAYRRTEMEDAGKWYARYRVVSGYVMQEFKDETIIAQDRDIAEKIAGIESFLIKQAIQQVQISLQKNIQAYRMRLKHKPSGEGKNEMLQIIARIIQDLSAITELYRKIPVPDYEIELKLERVKKTRNQFEKELEEWKE